MQGFGRVNLEKVGQNTMKVTFSLGKLNIGIELEGIPNIRSLGSIFQEEPPKEEEVPPKQLEAPWRPAKSQRYSNPRKHTAETFTNWKKEQGITDITNFPRPTADQLEEAVKRNPLVWSRLRKIGKDRRTLSAAITYEKRKLPRRIELNDLMTLYAGAREIVLHSTGDTNG